MRITAFTSSEFEHSPIDNGLYIVVCPLLYGLSSSYCDRIRVRGQVYVKAALLQQSTQPVFRVGFAMHEVYFRPATELLRPFE